MTTLIGNTTSLITQGGDSLFVEPHGLARLQRKYVCATSYAATAAQTLVPGHIPSGYPYMALNAKPEIFTSGALTEFTCTYYGVLNLSDLKKPFVSNVMEMDGVVYDGNPQEGRSYKYSYPLRRVRYVCLNTDITYISMRPPEVSDFYVFPNLPPTRLEFATISLFPATGEAGKTYFATDTNKAYQWNGMAYEEIAILPQPWQIQEAVSGWGAGSILVASFTTEYHNVTEMDLTFKYFMNGNFSPVIYPHSLRWILPPDVEQQFNNGWVNGIDSVILPQFSRRLNGFFQIGDGPPLTYTVTGPGLLTVDELGRTTLSTNGVGTITLSVAAIPGNIPAGYNPLTDYRPENDPYYQPMASGSRQIEVIAGS